MKEYRVKWCLPSAPENTFLSTELDNDSYDLVENEYSYDSFELVLPRQDLGDWCKVKTAQDTIVISDFSINNVSVTGNAIYQGNLNLGDYIQIEGEYFLVVNKSEVDGIKSANLSRNVGFTQRKQLHNATKYRPIIAYINGFFTPVGTEANIFDEDGLLVYMGVIEGVTTSGKNVVINMDSIIKSLDKDYYYNYKIFYDFNLPNWQYVTLQLILETLLDGVVVFAPDFWAGLPKFIVERQIRENNKLNPWTTLLEMMKLRNAYIQRKDGIFYVNTLTLTSPFSSSPTNVSIYDKMDLEGGYNVQLASTFTKASCNFRVLRGEDGEYKRVVEGAISGVTKVGEVTEVDIKLEKPIYLDTGYVPPLLQEPDKPDEITYLLSAIAGVRGLVYGYVTIVTIPDHTYVIGQRYKLTEVEEENKPDFMHFIPNSVDTIALCYSANKLECKFIIIENIVKNPISPAVLVKAISTTQLETFTSVTPNGGGLYTDKDTLEEARNPDYLYNYFDTGINVQIMNAENYTKHTEGLLYYVTPSRIEVDGASPFVVGHWYILEYNKDFASENYLMEHLRMGGGTI